MKLIEYFSLVQLLSRVRLCDRMDLLHLNVLERGIQTTDSFELVVDNLEKN